MPGSSYRATAVHREGWDDRAWQPRGEEPDARGCVQAGGDGGEQQVTGSYRDEEAVRKTGQRHVLVGPGARARLRGLRAPVVAKTTISWTRESSRRTRARECTQQGVLLPLRASPFLYQSRSDLVALTFLFYRDPTSRKNTFCVVI